jgi:5,6,7,8-tetrahydromethanopterin hydro-lyase
MSGDFGDFFRRTIGGTMNLSSGERALSIGIGLALVGTGLWRSGASGALIGIAGGLIALRGLAGHCPVKSMLGGGSRAEPETRGSAPTLRDRGSEPPGTLPGATAKPVTAAAYPAPTAAPSAAPSAASAKAGAFDRVLVGESLVGEGNEVAHIDLIMGPRGSAAEKAFCRALTDNKHGFTALLAIVAPNLMCKPQAILYNKVTIKGADQAVQMFGPAQHAVAEAIADCVADGTIPQSVAEDLFIAVGVFIHWDAKDNARIQDFNYRATKEAIQRAAGNWPSTREMLSRKDTEKHPFAA